MKAVEKKGATPSCVDCHTPHTVARATVEFIVGLTQNSRYSHALIRLKYVYFRIKGFSEAEF